jgi:D-glycero-D-manno-heptose 1,7-bisphosphate phosphatase
MDHRKAIFFDKDGTLIKDVPYNVDPAKVTYEPYAFESLRLLQQEGYTLIMVSNQSGIARGIFTEDKLAGLKHWLDQDFRRAGVTFEAFYFCPHHPCGIVDKYAIECNCRKPAPGMLLKAAGDLNVDLTRSWMIGDILNDIEAGNRAGCRSILINNGNETEWVGAPNRTPTALASNLWDACSIILSHNLSISYDNKLFKHH